MIFRQGGGQTEYRRVTAECKGGRKKYGGGERGRCGGEGGGQLVNVMLVAGGAAQMVRGKERVVELWNSRQKNTAGLEDGEKNQETLKGLASPDVKKREKTRRGKETRSSITGALAQRSLFFS